MGKKKPLTAEEAFIMSKLPRHDNVIRRTELDKDNGKGIRSYKWVDCERTPTEVRRLLKYRREGWNEGKYENNRRAFERLIEVIEKGDVENILEVMWMIQSAMKYQGYIQFQVAFAEHLYEQTLSEEERNERRAKRKLKTKVHKMNNGGRVW